MPKFRQDMVGTWVLRQTSTPHTYHHLQLRRAPADHLGGTWSFCRGGIDPAEPTIAAALRELREETGLTPVAFFSLGVVEQFYSYHMDAICQIPFFVAIVPPTAAVTLNDEHDTHRWLTDTEIEQHLVWSSEYQLLTEIRRYFFTNHPTLALMRIPLAT